MSKLYAGVDLGGTSMIAVIADRRGKILGSSDCATIREVNASETIDQIAEQIVLAAKEADIKPSKIESIGVGAPGAVSPEEGIVVRAPNLGWSDVPLSALLGKRLKKKVVLGNDVQVAILGEHAFGVASGFNRVVGIWVGTGIGGGLIINGKLDRGARGAAGEIGHMVLKEDGPVCGCGRTGCVEALASRTSMERDVRAATVKGKKSAVLQIMKERNKTRMTSSVMNRALKAGDPIMLDVLANAQHYLGLLAGNVVNLIDPEMVVIGGGVAQRLGEDFVGPIRELARSRFLRPDPEGRIRIEHSILGDYSGALGAASLAQNI
ncbi:MAG TPA: ROK family protein [Thermoanaerobaculia bacterium]|nr:ROK family protein [Thermoanaerobaculia bacterium]